MQNGITPLAGERIKKKSQKKSQKSPKEVPSIGDKPHYEFLLFARLQPKLFSRLFFLPAFFASLT